MTGKELFNKLTERDFSGSDADVYAQTLFTIWSHIGDDIYPLLEAAEQDGRKLDLKSSEPLQDVFSTDDIILV